MGDLNFEVREKDEAEQHFASGRGKTSRYEPVAQKWVEIEDDEAIVLRELSMNDVQNIRNLLYGRFGKENVIVRSSKSHSVDDGPDLYTAVVRDREDGEFLRNNGTNSNSDSESDSSTDEDENPFDDLEPETSPDEETETEGTDATDAAIDLALEHGVNLDDVEGTGSDGRILKSDVQDHIG